MNASNNDRFLEPVWFVDTKNVNFGECLSKDKRITSKRNKGEAELVVYLTSVLMTKFGIRAE